MEDPCYLPNSGHMKEIGRCVKLRRTMRNLTQESLGAMAGGLSQSTISRIEQGRPVRTDQLERVMHALNLRWVACSGSCASLV